MECSFVLLVITL